MTPSYLTVLNILRAHSWIRNICSPTLFMTVTIINVAMSAILDCLWGNTRTEIGLLLCSYT